MSELTADALKKISHYASWRQYVAWCLGEALVFRQEHVPAEQQGRLQKLPVLLVRGHFGHRVVHLHSKVLPQKYFVLS